MLYVLGVQIVNYSNKNYTSHVMEKLDLPPRPSAWFNNLKVGGVIEIRLQTKNWPTCGNLPF